MIRTVALIGAVSLIIFAVFQGKKSSENYFSINKIEIQGSFKYISKNQLQTDYESLIGKNLLTTSLSEIKTVALLPQWIQSVEVRKVWPKTLQVLVYEHEPLAYWNDRKIITTGAVVISLKSILNLPIPKLFSPEDSSDIVLQQFELISQVLSLTSLRIKTLKLDPRGAWVLIFKNGIYLKLGRENILERLQRFIAVYKTDLLGRMDQIISVDTRYPHGVAVAWKK